MPFESQKYTALGAVLAGSGGTTLTAAGTAHTKGTWVELAAAMPSVVRFFTVYITDMSAAGDYFLDIGIGAAASEQVVVENLPFAASAAYLFYGGEHRLPMALPAGQRLAARISATTLSLTARVHIVASAVGVTRPALQRCTTYGATLSTTRGISVDPGGVAHTKGTWSQITASSTYPMRAFILGVGNQLNNTARTQGRWLVDIGIGAAASEQVIIPDQSIGGTGALDVMQPFSIGPFYYAIPAGTRIAVRAASLVTDPTDRLFDATIHGMS